MATGRTISSTELTDTDRHYLEICQKISNAISNLISDKESRREFTNSFGKVNLSRDAGAGRGGGKLQRDALCTRGRQGKAPYSNRNLRWHPLIIAMKTPSYAKDIDNIEIIDGKLIFTINGNAWPSSEVHKLPDVYCASYEKWLGIKDQLKNWNDSDWTNNSCLIPSMEYSSREFSIETFAVLGIIASTMYHVEPIETHRIAMGIFKESGYTPSKYFPLESNLNEVILCPLCKSPLNDPPAGMKFSPRYPVFQPPWTASKRGEGDAESLQLFHSLPLQENEILHTPEHVRYGHRWCNVAMTDHSVNEAVYFFRSIVERWRIE